jgi:hypothetical protein
VESRQGDNSMSPLLLDFFLNNQLRGLGQISQLDQTIFDLTHPRPIVIDHGGFLFFIEG